MSAGAHENARFERLGPAAVGLLAPMLDDEAVEQPTRFADAFITAFEDCATVADSLGLRSLNYLLPLVSPYLRQQSRAATWQQALARLEPWIGDIVALCAGELDADEAAELVKALPEWPDFPQIPERFLHLIETRLREDTRQLAAGAQGARDDGVPVVDVALPPALALEVGSGQLTMARDELALLVEAVNALSLRLGDEPPLRPMSRAGAEAFGEQLGALAGALGHIGAHVLAHALEALAVAGAAPAQRSGAWPLALAGALRGYFAAPSVEAARSLIEQFRAPGAWLRFESDSLAALERQLATPHLVESRRVDTRTRKVQARDLSLEIPSDADSGVVDHLRRELPALSAQFSHSVDRILDGSVDALGEARRIAHTLSGSAVTVGVRGVATLTHQLEDLLQLLDESQRQPPPLLGVALAEAADCLGQMTDAVAGHGDAPHDALTVCELLADWVHRLASGGETEGETTGDTSDTTGEVAGEVAGEAPPEASPREPQDLQATREAREAQEQGQPPAGDEIVTEAPAARNDEVDAQAYEAVAAIRAEELPAAEAPGAETPGAASRPPDEETALRIPESLVDRMLDLAGEAAIVLAQVQEQLRELGQTHHGVRSTAERLSQLCVELDRAVDARSVSLDAHTGSRAFDPLELDAFDELHTLSRRIAEVGADDKLLDRQLERQISTMNDSVGRLERVQTDLREAVVRSRMVPVRSIAARLQRAARQAARIAGKSVSFELHGDEVGVDAQLLQALVDPLTHLLRNAVDHGIEDARRRAAAGKSALGKVALEFARQGQNLSIRCADDGCGLDYAAIRARAAELGLHEAHDAADAGELARLILRPGFSTRRAATELSGRGIGLDVVASAVARLRGTLRVDSVPGQGLSVTLVVPERIASLPVMVVRAAARVLALSIRGIESIVAAPASIAGGGLAQTCLHEGAELAAVRLDEALGLPAGALRPVAQPGWALASTAPEHDDAQEVMLIVARDDGTRVAVFAPETSQPRNVVMRPLPAWFPQVASIDGATVLGDGAVAPVIDLPSLLARKATSARAPDAPQEKGLAPRCLVADDSVSVRRAMEAFLHDLGLEVDSAADGLAALEQFDRRTPDLAILDLEMPRMNGLELAAAIRERATGGRRVPLIMITSRGSEKHREMALAAGVDVFMTKPYTEDELASAIRRCLERGAPLG